MIYSKKLTLIILPFLLLGCGDDDLDSSVIHAPDTYEFTSLTDPSASSSVDYKVAATRLMLIQELDYFIGSSYFEEYGQEHGKDAAVALLNRIYEGGTKSDYSNNLTDVNLYDDTSNATPISSIVLENDLTLLQQDFSGLAQGVNLKEVMPGILHDLHYRKSVDESLGDFVGWATYDVADGDLTPDILVDRWFSELALYVADADPETRFTKNRINVKNVLITFLYGAIAYDQAMAVYLSPSTLMNASNVSKDPLSAFTDLEGLWDNAFGYFGAPVNYKISSVENKANSLNIDADSDGKIDIFKEYTSYYARHAAINDLASTFSESTLSILSMDDFLIGRQIIQNSIDATEQAYKTEIVHLAESIAETWERIVASVAIRYINDTADEAILILNNKSEASEESYFDSWSLLKGTLLTMQFNPNSKLSYEPMSEPESDLALIHRLMISPPKPENINSSLFTDLNDIKQLLISRFNISHEDAESWRSND